MAQAIGELVRRRPIAGHVRVAAVASASVGILPPVLARVRRCHPGISVTMLEGTDDEVAEWLASGIVDIAIAMRSLAGAAQVLRTVDLVAVLPERHVLARDSVLDLRRLKGQSFVMSASGCEAAIVDHMQRVGVDLDIVLRVRDTRALLAAVAEGVGISILPSLTLAADTPGIVWRPPAPTLSRALTVSASEDISEAGQTLLEMLLEKRADQPVAQ